MNKDKLHVKAPGNWINDPNGFIYYKGKYHLFYQYFPYAPRWGTMHWGHAVSEDLVNWEHLGIALFPTRYEDQNGCFSGSAVEHEGRMYLYYTGVHYDQVNPEDIHSSTKDPYVSSQMLISSEDGIHFDNFYGKHVVVPALEDPSVGDKMDTRDPKVWRGRDAWYMVLGTKAADGNGKLLFYRSENLMDWTYINGAAKGNGFGYMWECPDVFETEGGKVLIISAMGLDAQAGKHTPQTICMPVEFTEDTCFVNIPDAYQFADYGLDFYAPQSTLDKEGRRVLVGWMRMPEAVDGKWNGMFCLPRVVEVKKGHIYFRVHPNAEAMFTRNIASVSQADGAPYRISLDIADGGKVNIGGYRISRKGNRIYTDRTAVYGDYEGFETRFASPEIKEGYHLDIYVDKNLVEIFINCGEYVISNVVYGLGDGILADFTSEMKISTLPLGES